MDGSGSYSVAHRAGLPPTELTGMWSWILLRSPHQGRGSPQPPPPLSKGLTGGWGGGGLLMGLFVSLKQDVLGEWDVAPTAHHGPLGMQSLATDSPGAIMTMKPWEMRW